MNILLINNNPVVSRLLALCTRDENMTLEEVKNVITLKHDAYDVVFVDEASYLGRIQKLSKVLNTKKKILFSNEDVEISDFDMTIKKPFLPSQIMEVLIALEASKENVLGLEDELYEIKNKVLDSGEIEKIKILLDMEDEQAEEEELSDEAYEQRKIEVIKEQLIAEGLEIVSEDEIVEELSEKNDDASVITMFSREKRVSVKDIEKKKSCKSKSKKKKTKKKKKIDFTQEELEQIEDAVEVAIASLKKKQMRKLLKGKEVEVMVKLEGNN